MEPNDNDMLLISKMVNGDETALREFMVRHSRRLYYIVKQILGTYGTGELIEEIITDTFLKVWTHSQEYNPDIGPVIPWVNKIAQYETLMKRRKLIREKSKTVEFDTNIDILATNNENTVERIDAKIKIHQVLCLLRQNNHTDASIVEMKYLKGFTTNDIAETLNITPNLARVRLFRALKKMREIIIDITPNNIEITELEEGNG